MIDRRVERETEGGTKRMSEKTKNLQRQRGKEHGGKLRRKCSYWDLKGNEGFYLHIFSLPKICIGNLAYTVRVSTHHLIRRRREITKTPVVSWKNFSSTAEIICQVNYQTSESSNRIYKSQRDDKLILCKVTDSLDGRFRSGWEQWPQSIYSRQSGRLLESCSSVLYDRIALTARNLQAESLRETV